MLKLTFYVFSARMLNLNVIQGTPSKESQDKSKIIIKINTWKTLVLYKKNPTWCINSELIGLNSGIIIRAEEGGAPSVKQSNLNLQFEYFILHSIWYL